MKKTFTAIFMLLLLLATSFFLVSCQSEKTNYEVRKAAPADYDFAEERTEIGKLVGTEHLNSFYSGELLQSEEYLIGGGITINPNINGEFNKMTFKYISDVPVKLAATYTLRSGEVMVDTLYLEAGRNRFEAFVVGFEKKQYAGTLQKISISKCKNDGHFLLWKYEVEKADAPAGETIFIKNGKYKLGVYMSQGGGLNYLSDSSLPNLKKRNLLNEFDAGRLVQQSYYGTKGNDEYQSGEFNNAHWSYNPVQGGDQYQNTSRIINYVAGENSVYVKCQPMDWSLDDFRTPSYMESTYTVHHDRIEVDCRFVDFSGWEHPSSTQEIPAFYTISYLDTFSYYSGDNAWSNAPVTTLEDLPFWGDPENYDSCYYFFEGNAENWCSWTNSDFYGIGLYSPDSTSMVFGRSGDGHSKNSKKASCSYVAPLFDVQLQSFVPLSYSYLITTGSVEQMREIFYQQKI